MASILLPVVNALVCVDWNSFSFFILKNINLLCYAKWKTKGSKESDKSILPSLASHSVRQLGIHVAHCHANQCGRVLKWLHKNQRHGVIGSGAKSFRHICHSSHGQCVAGADFHKSIRGHVKRPKRQQSDRFLGDHLKRYYVI